MSAFDSSNPEGGYYWRGLEPAEVATFNNPAVEYGRPAGTAPTGLPELFGMPSMKQKVCARFFSTKRNAVDWAKAMGAGAMVLAVPQEPLVRGTDYDVWSKTDDVYITGEAVRAHGTLYAPNAVP